MSRKKFIGEQLKRARVPKTQAQVAEDIKKIFNVHMSQKILSRLEKGERDLTAEELWAFCRYFRRDPFYFLEMLAKEPKIAEEFSSYETLEDLLNDLSPKDQEYVRNLIKRLKKK